MIWLSHLAFKILYFLILKVYVKIKCDEDNCNEGTFLETCIMEKKDLVIMVIHGLPKDSDNSHYHYRGQYHCPTGIPCIIIMTCSSITIMFTPMRNHVFKKSHTLKLFKSNSNYFTISIGRNDDLSYLYMDNYMSLPFI